MRADNLERLTANERTSVEEARQRAVGMRAARPDLERYRALNRENPTGALGQIIGQSLDQPQYAADVGIDEMLSLEQKLAPRQRVQGSGTTSDRDIMLFRGALPSIRRVGNSNANIIRGLLREADEAQAYAEFLDWYWPQAGTTSGAQEAWRGYVERHPDLDVPWREAFAARATPTQPRAQSGAPRPRGVPEDLVQGPGGRWYEPDDPRVRRSAPQPGQ